MGPTLACHDVRLDEDTEQVVCSEADLVAGHAEDAGIAGPKHQDAGTAAQAELLEPVYVVGLSGNAANAGRLTGEQIAQWDGLVNHYEVPKGA